MRKKAKFKSEQRKNKRELKNNKNIKDKYLEQNDK